MSTDQYLCPSYYDNDNVLRDCSCGKCDELPILDFDKMTFDTEEREDYPAKSVTSDPILPAKSVNDTSPTPESPNLSKNSNSSDNQELRAQVLTVLKGFGVSGGRFNERTDTIMQLITAHTARVIEQATVEARIDELGNCRRLTDEHIGSGLDNRLKRRIAELKKLSKGENQ